MEMYCSAVSLMFSHEAWRSSTFVRKIEMIGGGEEEHKVSARARSVMVARERE